MARAPEPSVSDHAVVRWLERVYGVDIDAVRRHILTTAIRNAILLGATSIVVDGWKYVLADKQIVTIVKLDKIIRPRPGEIEDDDA